MPVKVRCPSCDKQLNAPDAARGKAVKCPGCQTRISVPAGEDDPFERAVGRAGAKKKKKAGQDTIDFLVNTDLSRAVDSSANLCPKCGADIPDDAAECPACGVDPATGQLSEAARRRKLRPGSDPDEFYSVAWKNSWKFTKDNSRVALRLIGYITTFALIAAGCAFMVSWCTNGPPRTFWGGFGVVCALVIPGVVWSVTMEIIRATVARKDSVRDINFDFFTNASLGIKTILWAIVFCAWLPPVFLMYPLAMIHMAMPVTKKGWMFPVVLPIFLRHLKPVMFWWLAFLTTNILLIGGWAAVLIAAWRPINELQTSLAEGKGIPLAVGLGVGVILSLVMFSFTLLFNGRFMALLAYYFRNTLSLDVLVPEKTYVRKEIQLDAFGNPVKTKGDKSRDIVVMIVALLAIVAVGYYLYTKIFPKPPGDVRIDRSPVSRRIAKIENRSSFLLSPAGESSGHRTAGAAPAA